MKPFLSSRNRPSPRGLTAGSSSQLFKFNAHFVPITKTPWGGTQISALKKKYHAKFIPRLDAVIPHVDAVIPHVDAVIPHVDAVIPHIDAVIPHIDAVIPHIDAVIPRLDRGIQSENIPLRIGESIEGQKDSFLLKWIDAIEPLSVQIHPENSNPLLKNTECGKPEAWFVYHLLNPTPVYLGFKEGYSKEEIQNCLLSENPTACLHSFIPNKNDYISIPPGCVHALGAGILIAEPQKIMPHKEGKTWRIFDWDRRYNAQGEKDVNGKPRELHLQQALSAIDWKLPRGTEIEKFLVTNLKHEEKFLGSHYNPFCVQLYSREGQFTFIPFTKNEFAFITVFSGIVKVSNTQHTIQLTGGESGFIPSSDGTYKIEVSQAFHEDPCALIFGLQKN